MAIDLLSGDHHGTKASVQTNRLGKTSGFVLGIIIILIYELIQANCVVESDSYPLGV